VRFEPVGEPDPEAGPPTQLGVFQRAAAPAPAPGQDGRTAVPAR